MSDRRNLSARISREGEERRQLIEQLGSLLGDDIRSENEIHLTTREAALLLRVSTATVRRWADEGKLAAHRSLGGHRKFPLTEVRNVMRRLNRGEG